MIKEKFKELLEEIIQQTDPELTNTTFWLFVMTNKKRFIIPTTFS